MWLHKTIICPICSINNNNNNNAAVPTCHNREQHNTNLWQVSLPQQRLHHHSPTIWTSIMSTDSNWMDADAFEGFFGQGTLGTGHRQSDRHPQRMNSTQHAETFNGAGQYTKRKGGTSQDASQKADQQWQGRATGGSYIQSCQTFKCQIFKKSDKLSGLVIQAELNNSNSI